MSQWVRPKNHKGLRAVDDPEGERELAQKSLKNVDYYASLEPLRKCDANELRVDVGEGEGTPFSFRIDKRLMAIIQDICATRCLPSTNPGEYGRSAVTLWTTQVIGKREDIPQRFKEDIKLYNNTLREIQRRSAEDNASALMGKASQLIRTKFAAVPRVGAKEWLRLERRLARVYKGELKEWAIAEWATRKDIAKVRQYAIDNREELEQEMDEQQSWGYDFDDELPEGVEE